MRQHPDQRSHIEVRHEEEERRPQRRAHAPVRERHEGPPAPVAQEEKPRQSRRRKSRGPHRSRSRGAAAEGA